MNGAIELYKLELVRVIQANDRIKLRINYEKLHHSHVWATRDMQSTCTQLLDFLVVVSNKIHRVINGTMLIVHLSFVSCNLFVKIVW